MKKLTRKLFVSLMTLVLTAMALGTSTFAWFSMNTTASATNMTVTAKSNATYLLIGTGTDDTYQEIQAKEIAQALSVAAVKSDGTDNNNRYPAYFCNADNETYATLGTTTATTALTKEHWYTASNTNSNSATNAVVNVSDVTSELTNYAVKYSVWLTLSADSEAYNGYIKLTFNKGTATATGTDDDALSAVVYIGGSYYKLDASNSVVFTGAKLDITKTSVLQADIYVYINGKSTNVNSTFINTQGNSLTGTVGVTFDLTFNVNTAS